METLSQPKPAGKPRQQEVPGMGSILHDNGVYFRVWAPNAKKVSVAGDFNEWKADADPLTAEGDGYWGVNVSSAKAGQQYKYVLDTDQGQLWKNDPYAREIKSNYGNTVIIDTNFDWGEDDYKMPAWNTLLIYEMHVGTFFRKHPEKPGTFYDVIDKLPYLQQLGVTAIEIMPPTEFPGAISWGYNPSHPFAIEAEYGGVTGLKTLIREAHKFGIAVILDIVYNHFGPDDLDLWQFDGWSENGAGGIYFYQDWRSKTPWGDSRPDYGRPEVRQYIRDNAVMWLDEFRVDGLRTDAITFVRNVTGHENPAEDIPDGWSLMQWINKEVEEKFPWKITIAEDLKSNAWITKHFEDGGEGFSSQWDANFIYPVRRVLEAANDQDRDLAEIEKAVTFYYNGTMTERVIYTESHDEVANGKKRLPEEISPADAQNWFAKKRAVLGSVLVFTSPGIPMIFQGQEMLEDGEFTDRDELDWEKAVQFGGMVKLYRDLMNLRKNSQDLTRGLKGGMVEVLLRDDEQKIFAFHRWDQGGPRDSTVVVMNFADQDHQDLIIPFPEEGLWKIRFNSDWKGYDASFGNEYAYDTETLDSQANEGRFEARVNLPKYGALILSRD